MIEVKNLTKKYGDTIALKDVSFKIESGHVYGLLGANGAGKSTTMNIITGCLAPSFGSVRICGYDIASHSEKAKANVGYLPEIPPLYVDMTVSEYLKFVAAARKFTGDTDAHIESVMEKTGIEHVSNRLIKNLSKGYRQRVGIAQALIGKAKIIVLDEPMAGLDPKQIIEIRELISSLSPEHTVIISSHILSEIEEMCDRIIIISNGKLIACGSPDALRRELLGPDTLELEVKASAEKTLEILKTVGSIGKVSLEEIENGICKASVEIKGETDLREKIFFAFARAKAAVLTINLQKPHLEDLFLLATENEEDKETEPKDDDKNEKAPSIREFLKKSIKSTKNETDTDESDDDDSYRPLFGRR